MNNRLEIENKKKIQSSLNNFHSGDLFTNSINLFETLGYSTERQKKFDNSTSEEFIDKYLNDKEPKEIEKFKEKTFLKDWKIVELLFQLTDSEMQEMSSLFKSKKVDNIIMNSYLFFAIELKEKKYTRTILATITRQINKLFPMPVMILFKYNYYLTLSIINRRLHKKDPSKDVLEKIILIKDINIKNPHRAHIEILFDLNLNQIKTENTVTNFVELHNAWRKILDINELNKKFYQEISSWYHYAMEHIVFPDDVEKDREKRNATNLIRLLTRIIFIWFIKEKGLIPEELFKKDKIDQILNYNDENKSTYYKAILQNLFFAALNNESNKKEFVKRQYGISTYYRYERFFKDKEKALKLFKYIPFLNGGLFENLDKYVGTPYERRVDCFSNSPKNGRRLKVPDELFFSEPKFVDLNKTFDTKNKKYKFQGIVNILNSYKFTIEENTPIEEEIALDPELLGKVFENLLAAFNPETKETARKSTGSYYTPRRIVDYMVDESLKNSLANMVVKKLKNNSYDNVKTGLDLLFEYTEENHCFKDEEVDKIIKAISEIKILDPACGSGAFPMGILHKLVFILNKLDPENKIWRNIQKERVLKEVENVYDIEDKKEREEQLKDIDEAFEYNTSDYGRKLYLIENSIYGVDIQPIAVQISKLRFFISLIVDQKIDRDKENYGIRPLPNLETKFVAANSLIEIEKPENHLFATHPEVKKLEDKLKKIRHKIFGAKTPQTKGKYRKLDKDTREEIAFLLGEKAGFSNKSARHLAAWDPYDQNCSSPFFDMEWMFGITDGFDIVIANPPYVRQEKIKEQKKQFENYTVFNSTSDLYTYFYELAYNIAKKNGIVTFISSNKWMRANYGKKLRRFFKNKTSIKEIIDFGGYKVFESATVDTNIIILKKPLNPTTKKGNVNIVNIDDDFKKDANIYEYKEKKSFKIPQSKFSEDLFLLASENIYNLKEKIEKIGTPLKDWDINIYYGIKTGLNEAFIIDTEKRNEILSNCETKEEKKRTEKIIKPILRGRDIKRYYYEWADLWVISTFPTLRLNINNFPAIERYLLDHFDKRQLEQSGKKYPQLGFNARKKTGNKWFETQDQIAYYEEFEKEKIVWRRVTQSRKFILDFKKYYCEDTTHIITGENLQYILSILNSKAGEFLFYKFYQGGGIKGEIKGDFIKKLPIPSITEENQHIVNELEEIVNKILDITKDDDYSENKEKQAKVKEYENQIDIMVYKLYNLTDEEIEIVEGADE
ncbi:MAG: Eco57I restriction-modification methylase domain-containing protein [Promethearchaeota archaeon]